MQPGSSLGRGPGARMGARISFGKGADVNASAPSTTLRSGALGVAGIVFLVLAAVAPLTGTIVVASLAIALGNGGGTPMSFVLVATTLLLFAVGYA